MYATNPARPLPVSAPAPAAAVAARFVATVADEPVATADTLQAILCGLEAHAEGDTDLALWHGRKLLAVLAAGRLVWLREIRST